MAFVRGLGLYLPDDHAFAADIAAASDLSVDIIQDDLGIARKTVAGPTDHTCAMGVQAAFVALDDAGLNPSAVDLVIATNGFHRETPGLVCGSRMTTHLGASRARSFDIGPGSDSNVIALMLGASLMASDPSLNTIVVAGGYRDGDLVDYADPNAAALFDLGAGAAAAVVCRDGPGHEILATAVPGGTRNADGIAIPVGGTREPLAPDNAARYSLTLSGGAPAAERLRVELSKQMEQAIRDAVAASGNRLSDLAYLALPHIQRPAHYDLLTRLGLPPDHSIYLAEYGHIGPVDPLLSLELARRSERVKPGELIVAVGAGLGSPPAAICLRWGDA